MESLLSIKYTDDISRVNYYYDIYQYRCVIRLHAVEFIRLCNFDSNKFDYWMNHITYKNGVKSKWKNVISDKKSLLKSICDWVGQNKKNKDVKITFSSNTISLYYNDENSIVELLNVIRSNEQQDINLRIKFSRSSRISNFERGVVYLANPKAKFRLYFSYMRLSVDEENYILDYLRNIDNMSCSYQIRRWLRDETQQMTPSWYSPGVKKFIFFRNTFIDVDDDSHATFLNLYRPGIIYKVNKIEKRINNMTNGV